MLSSLIHSVAIVLCSRAQEKNTKKGPHRGLGGFPTFFYPNSYFFCEDDGRTVLKGEVMGTKNIYISNPKPWKSNEDDGRTVLKG